MPTLAMPWETLADVLARARAGDREACGLILVAYGDAVRRRVHRRLQGDVRRRHPWVCGMFSTGDIVQEVLLAVVRGLPRTSFPNERALVGYLARLVRNRLVDVIRAHSSKKHNEQLVHREAAADALVAQATAGEPAAQAAERAEQAATVQTVIAQLSEKDRTLVRLRLLEEAQFHEIATQLGYASAATARLAFLSAHARLLVKLRAAGVRAEP